MNQQLLLRNLRASGIARTRVVEQVIARCKASNPNFIASPKTQRIGISLKHISSIPSHIPRSAAGSEPLEPPHSQEPAGAPLSSTTDDEEPVKPVVLGVRLSFEDVYYYINIVYWSLLFLSVLFQNRYLEAVSHFRNFVSALSLTSSAFAGWHALRWYQDVRNQLGSSQRKRDFRALMKYGWRAAFWLAFTLWYMGPTVDFVTDYTGTPGAIMCLYGLALAGSAALMAGSWSFFGDPHVPRRLITGGPYALLRHPQALGNMLFLVGFSLSGGAVASAVAFAASFALYCIAVLPKEESMLESTFTSKYRHWKERVPRFAWGLLLLLILEAVLMWRFSWGGPYAVPIDFGPPRTPLA